MTWWVERYRRFGDSELVDEVQLRPGLKDDDVRAAVSWSGTVRDGGWKVKGPLLPLVVRYLPDPELVSPVRRVFFVYFLAYYED